MRRLSRVVALTLALLFALVAPALADMTGTYAGTGEVEGTTLELQQYGFQVQGQYSGTHNGSLFGQTDGGNYVQGYLDEGGIRYTFYGNLTDAGFALTLYDTNGNTATSMFAAANTPSPNPNPKPSQPEKPAASYYTFQNGAQAGPFTLDALLDQVKSGTVGRTTMIWQPGQPQWQPAQDIPEVADALPPEPPKAVDYFVVENGQQVGPLSLEQMNARIANGQTSGTDFAWKAGMEAWAPAGTFTEFAEALKPAPTPPPAPVPPPAPATTTTSPPPPPAPATTTTVTTAEPPPAPMTTTTVTTAEPPAAPATTTTTTTVAPPAAPEATTTTAPTTTTTTTTAEPVAATTTTTTTVAPPPAPAATTTSEPVAATTTTTTTAEPVATTTTAEPASSSTTTTAEPVTTTTAAPPPPAPSPTTTTTTMGATLENVLDGMLKQELANASDSVRTQVRDCSITTMGMLSASERQMLVDSQLNISEAQKTQIETAHPGFAAAMEACYSLAGNGKSAESSATVSLPNGRKLTIVSDGGAQSVSAVAGGYNVVVGTVRIAFVNGKLTVNGDIRTVPNFSKTLTISVHGGSVSLSAD